MPDKCVANEIRHKKPAKNAELQKIYKLGVILQFIRSTLFNLFMLAIGVIVGMSFTLMNIQKAWKERYNSDSLIKLEHVLRKHNVDITEINHIMFEMRNKRIEFSIGECSNKSCPNQKNNDSY